MASLFYVIIKVLFDYIGFAKNWKGNPTRLYIYNKVLLKKERSWSWQHFLYEKIIISKLQWNNNLVRRYCFFVENFGTLSRACI